MTPTPEIDADTLAAIMGFELSREERNEKGELIKSHCLGQVEFADANGEVVDESQAVQMVRKYPVVTKDESLKISYGEVLARKERGVWKPLAKEDIEGRYGHMLPADELVLTYNGPFNRFQDGPNYSIVLFSGRFTGEARTELVDNATLGFPVQEVFEKMLLRDATGGLRVFWVRSNVYDPQTDTATCRIQTNYKHGEGLTCGDKNKVFCEPSGEAEGDFYLADFMNIVSVPGFPVWVFFPYDNIPAKPPAYRPRTEQHLANTLNVVSCVDWFNMRKQLTALKVALEDQQPVEVNEDFILPAYDLKMIMTDIEYVRGIAKLQIK
jgi:hypothetical protein